MGALERKFLDLKLAGISVVAEDGQPVTVTGYGSTFDAEPDCYGDLVAPGSYAKTIGDWQSRPYAMPMLLEHGQATVGKWVALSEDARGLLVRGELTPGHSVAADAAASLRHGAVTGLSIGFRPTSWEWDDKTGVRTLTGIDLYEVSLVGTPANTTARVTGVKALSEDGDFKAACRSMTACRKGLDGHPAGDPLTAAKKTVLMGHCAAALRAMGEDPDGDGDDGPKGLSLRDFERRARDRLGLSRREAATLAEHGFDGLLRLWEERAAETGTPPVPASVPEAGKAATTDRSDGRHTGERPAPRDAAASNGATRLLEALKRLRLDANPDPGTNQ